MFSLDRLQYTNIHIYTQNFNRLLFISLSLKSYNYNGVNIIDKTRTERNRYDKRQCGRQKQFVDKVVYLFEIHKNMFKQPL